MMTKVFAALGMLAAAAGAISGAFIWILLTEPTTMAAALEAGDVRLLIAALTGAAN
jgi:hypothetical protein